MCLTCAFAEPKVKAKVKAIVDEYMGKDMDDAVLATVGERVGSVITGSAYLHGRARLRFVNGVLYVEFLPLPASPRSLLN